MNTCQIRQHPLVNTASVQYTNVHSFYNTLALPVVEIFCNLIQEIIELGLETHWDFLTELVLTLLQQPQQGLYTKLGSA